MKILDAIAIAKMRFHRDSFRGYIGNRWRPDRAGWRRLVLNVKRLCEHRGIPLEMAREMFLPDMPEDIK